MDTPKQLSTVAILLTIILLSALGVIYIQAKNRQLFSTLQSLQESRDQLYLRWERLLLEQSAWATQARIQHIATEQLNMQTPQQKTIVMIPINDNPIDQIGTE